MKEHEKNDLIDLIKKGGVFRDIPGATPLEVLTNTLQIIPLSAKLNREALLQAILEREALMPTGIGNGIALPHPRNPFVATPDEQFVVIGFLRQMVDWKALDSKAVHTIFLIVSCNAKLHLHTLARINFFCQQESLLTLLKNQDSQERIIELIQEAEQTWK
jgi:PTS system nitrogen regulatory IIA component